MKPMEKAWSDSYRITGTPAGIRNRNSYSFFAGSDIQSLGMRISILASRIICAMKGEKGEDPEEDYMLLFDELLPVLFMLGLPDGGETSLEYINGRLAEGKSPVTAYEILVSRLKRIFRPGEELLSEEVLDELQYLYRDNPASVETYTVRTAYRLLIAADYRAAHGGGDMRTGESAKFAEADRLGAQYRDTGSMRLAPEYEACWLQATQALPGLPEACRKALDGPAERYNCGETDREAFIRELSDTPVVPFEMRYRGK